MHDPDSGGKTFGQTDAATSPLLAHLNPEQLAAVTLPAQPALILALLFVLGMIITDGINGWFISKLIRRSDQTARLASRVMALAVSGVSLLVACLGIASQLFDSVEQWRDGKEMWFGVAVIAVVVLSYLGGQLMVRRGRHGDLGEEPGL